MRVERWSWGDPLSVLWRCLERGGVLFLPTGSSYAVGVDPRNPAGVEAVYRLKKRERGEPLPVVLAARRQLAELEIDPDGELVRAVASFWPGPLSVVLPSAREWPAAAGTGTLAVRVPGHRRLRELAAELGPLTATSANLSGASPVVDGEELMRLFADADGILVDDGRLPGGLPSTLVAWRDGGWRLLRPGRHPARELEALFAEGSRLHELESEEVMR